MKLTRRVVKQFEKEQVQHGTKVALHNIIWNIAYSLFKDIGVIGIKTTYKKRK